MRCWKTGHTSACLRRSGDNLLASDSALSPSSVLFGCESILASSADTGALWSSTCVVGCSSGVVGSSSTVGCSSAGCSSVGVVGKLCLSSGVACCSLVVSSSLVDELG